VTPSLFTVSAMELPGIGLIGSLAQGGWGCLSARRYSKSSLDRVVETGLPVRRPEKISVRTLSSVLSDTFSSPFENMHTRNCSDFARFQE
jgi:hypothetical protein